MKVEVAAAIVDLQLGIRKLQEKAAGELSQNELSELFSDICLVAYKAALSCLRKGENQ